MATALEVRPSFMVVAVSGGTWCWWSLDQIEAAHQRGFGTVPAIEGQGRLP